MAMPDLQQYPWNLNLIKSVEAAVVFCFLLAKIAHLILQKTRKYKKQFEETKTRVFNSYLIRQELWRVSL